MLQPDNLVKLATLRMPFGRYQGKRLMDLPESYLLWFEKQGFPKGEMGTLLQLMLEIDRNGLKYLLEPLRNEQSRA
jgi:uncharacterized protein (DUF3820 family)